MEHAPTIRRDASADALGRAAAAHAARAVDAAILLHGTARIVVATGASQFAFLTSLVRDHAVDWSKVEMFHLDEYIGIPASHPASFRRYLRERFVEPAGITRVQFLDVDEDPDAVRRRVGAALAARDPDVAFVGIGENGHLAFNDPPADFETREPYLEVALDAACRQQQVGEGWFARLEDVPERAVSMSIRQILRAREILVIVPDTRKAEAVRRTLQGPIDPSVPASALRWHGRVTLYLDPGSASLLPPEGGSHGNKEP